MKSIQGKTGIGFRKDFAEEFLNENILQPNFIEVAPENWIDMGGYWKRIFDKVTEQYPLTCHGLSLSIGSPDELDWDFLKKLKVFLKQYNVQIYSEHLSYAKCDNAHLYDLLPIPFREDAVNHIVERIKNVQDFLEQKIAIENVSYYTAVAAEMDEPTFISNIVNGADCNLLLDVNNVYVNAFNHKYDAKEFIKKIPLDKVAYIHMAGHLQVEEDLIIDTHGENIIDPVFDLFDYTTRLIKPVPVLLERDFNFPEFNELQGELNRLQKYVITFGYHNMLLQTNTKKIQSKLADYCRTGELTLTTEVNQKHVHHYRRLVYNIIDDMLQSAFPIFYEFADTEMWDEIVNTFFSTHACQTPHVWKVPGEFYQYACDNNLKEKYNLPFLEDLLLFEWIELDIHTMKDEEFPVFKTEGNWSDDVLVVNPEYRILSVKYPVHTTSPIAINVKNPGQYFILIFREPQKGSVQFLDISILYALTIEKIEEEKTITEITDELQTVFSFADKAFAQEQIIKFCKDLQHKDFVLGFKNYFKTI